MRTLVNGAGRSAIPGGQGVVGSNPAVPTQFRSRFRTTVRSACTQGCTHGSGDAPTRDAFSAAQEPLRIRPRVIPHRTAPGRFWSRTRPAARSTTSSTVCTLRGPLPCWACRYSKYVPYASGDVKYFRAETHVTFTYSKSGSTRSRSRSRSRYRTRCRAFPSTRSRRASMSLCAVRHMRSALDVTVPKSSCRSAHARACAILLAASGALHFPARTISNTYSSVA